MGQLAEQRGNKQAGYLIKSEDWNAVVAAIEDLDAALNKRIDGVETALGNRIDALDQRLVGQIASVERALAQRIGDVEGRLGSAEANLGRLAGDLSTLRGDFGTFRATVEPLLSAYYRVTMETAKLSYALGETAEVTARVTDLLGRPLSLASEAARPWIDFVAAWGQLRAVRGFTSRGGAGDRTVSVRVDSQGVARVRLGAEHSEGLPDEAEEEVATSLKARVGDGDKTIAETILEAETPLDSRVRSAYRTMTVQYDRADALSVRAYTDAYYAKNAAQALDARAGSAVRQNWRDYRSIVMAFAKADSDPRTPDQSRGVSSIQVTFRDWIGPWITLDYLAETGPLARDLRDRLIPKITDDFAVSLRNFQGEVGSFVAGKGLVGKQRAYKAARDALDQVTVPQPPAFLNAMTRGMSEAVGVQQAIQAAAGGAAGEDVAFRALTENTARSDAAVHVLQQKVNTVEKNASDASGRLSTLQSSVSSLDGRLNATLAEGGTLRLLDSKLENVRQQVGVLQSLDVVDLQNKLAEVRVIKDDLRGAKEDLTRVKDRLR